MNLINFYIYSEKNILIYYIINIYIIYENVFMCISWRWRKLYENSEENDEEDDDQLLT